MKRILAAAGWIAMLAALFSAPLSAAEPLSIRDYVSLAGFSDVEISPDGRRVAWVLTSPDFTSSSYRSDIVLIDVDGRHRLSLAHSAKHDTRPRWSPDGKTIAFLSDRDGSNQIYLIQPDGGESRKLTDLPVAVSGLAWSPTGKEIAFLMPDEPTDAQKERKKQKKDARVVDEATEKRHLHVIDVASGRTRRITGGEFSVVSFDWSPDGTRFAIARTEGPGLEGYFDTDLYIVSSRGGDLRPIVVREGADSGPRFSPDGTRIAFFTTGGDSDWAGQTLLAVVPTDGGEPRVVGKAYERSSQTFEWGAGGKELWFAGPWNTTRQIFRTPVDGEGLTNLSNVAGVIDDAAFDIAHGRAVFTYQTLTEPPELYVSDLAKFSPRRLTSENGEFRGRSLGETKLIAWTNPKDGLRIEGLLTLPIGYRAGQRVPLLTFVHGGPASYFDQQFLGYLASLYPAHVFAANGYAMLRPNPRGTGSYPEPFRQANRADWGGMDFLDIQAGIDTVIAMGIADPDRLGIMGWSYGGFMSAWAITQTDRFKAASIGAPVVDLMSFHGTTDIPGFTPSYFEGLPWKTPELYIAHSPMWHIANVKTPALIQHGEADDRVPYSQGAMLHRALKELGVPTVMIAYPRSPHVPREPNLRMDVACRNLWWFDSWLKGSERSVDEYCE